MAAGTQNAYVDDTPKSWRVRLLFLVVVLTLFAGIVILAKAHHLSAKQLNFCTSVPSSPAPAGKQWVCGANNAWFLRTR